MIISITSYSVVYACMRVCVRLGVCVSEREVYGVGVQLEGLS